MHPFVKILCFIMLLLLSNILSTSMIWFVCILAVALALNLHCIKFLRVIKRMRWLFISIFVIYAFGTPGQYIQYFPTSYASTIEGCSLGALQIAKLLIALASLNVFFSTSSKEDLMVGLYLLLSPLKLAKLNVARFTARLLLTLDYVEELSGKENFKFNFSQLDDLHSVTDNLQVQQVIILKSPAFNLVDKLLITSMIFSLLLLTAYQVFA